MKPRWALVFIAGIGLAIVFGKDKEPDSYYEPRFLPKQREALIHLLEGKGMSQSMRDTLLRVLRNSPKYEILSEAPDWDELDALAKERGCSVADLFFHNPKRKAA